MTDAKSKFSDLASSFKVVMLVTQGADGFLRARPMTIAESEENGTMWFLTSKEGWSRDVHEDIPAAITMQGGSKYVSISGIATVVDDRDRITRLWSLAMKPWFPGGPSSPDICLVQFVADQGEYWDASGRNGLRYLYDAIKAVAKGERVEERDEREHGSVSV